MEQQQTETTLVPAIDLIARRCGISRKTAERLVQNGTVPTVRVGKLYRIHPEDLDRWIQAGGSQRRV